MNILDEQRKQFVSSIAANKDEIIRKAINSVIGENWCINDLSGRGEFIRLPDKTEIFKLDGMELIHFMVPRTEIDDSKTSTTINSVQEYRFLNLAAE